MVHTSAVRLKATGVWRHRWWSQGATSRKVVGSFLGGVTEF